MMKLVVVCVTVIITALIFGLRDVVVEREKLLCIREARELFFLLHPEQVSER